MINVFKLPLLCIQPLWLWMQFLFSWLVHSPCACSLNSMPRHIFSAAYGWDNHIQTWSDDRIYFTLIQQHLCRYTDIMNCVLAWVILSSLLGWRILLKNDNYKNQNQTPTTFSVIELSALSGTSRKQGKEAYSAWSGLILTIIQGSTMLSCS